MRVYVGAPHPTIDGETAYLLYLISGSGILGGPIGRIVSSSRGELAVFILDKRLRFRASPRLVLAIQPTYASACARPRWYLFIRAIPNVRRA